MSDTPERVRVDDHVWIYQRGRRKTWTAEFRRDGRHCRQSLKTSNKKAALRLALKLAAELAAGTHRPAPKPVPVTKACEDYLAYLDTEGRAAKTLTKYRGVFALFAGFLAGEGVVTLSQVTASTFDRFRAARKKAGRGRKTMYTEGVIVKQLFRWSKRHGLVAGDPLADVPLSKPPLEPKGGPSLAQVDRVLATAAPADRLPLAVLAFTGMRSGELRRLRPADYDPAGGWLHVVSRPGAETKTRRSRKVPVHPRLRPLLDALPAARREWLVTGPAAGGPIDVRKLNERFQAAVRSLGLPAGRKAGGFVLHSLRHFFETFCVNARVPQRAVDAWLGHAPDKGMGSNYYRLSDEDSQRFMGEVPFGAGLPAADAGAKE